MTLSETRTEGRGATVDYRMYIDGAWVDSSEGGRFDSINPFFNQPWATAPMATPSDVDAAVSAARRAFEEGPWATSTPAYRAKLLRTLGGLIEDRADDLIRVQVSENGKLATELGPQTRGLAGYC
jgi:acyl-CoA reductase-like NAD-dependent aldehyde dehydrogenase